VRVAAPPQRPLQRLALAVAERPQLETARSVLRHAIGATLFDERKLRMLRLIGLYAYDGWRGTFRSVPPPRWGALGEAPDPVAYLRAESLRYDGEVAEPVRPLPARAARPTPVE
jgi:hypothetical protein